mmetsp:Transcript_23064/g.92278  ORF Transcript_23064/g.92278 Transcript_23064/m.92278 type:complete len:195 (-) Transcript_23064:1118-1702(-)
MVDPEPTQATRMAKLAKLQASVRMGGKGTMRRKKKATHRTAPTDDRRFQATIKKMGMAQITGIEEVNLFRDDGTVTNFMNPTVQAQLHASTYVISGQNQTKPLQDMLPSLINQLGPDNIKNIKNLMEHLVAKEGGENGPAEEGDEEIPELMETENFENVDGQKVSLKIPFFDMSLFVAFYGYAGAKKSTTYFVT